MRGAVEDVPASILLEMAKIREEIASGAAAGHLRSGLCNHNLQTSPMNRDSSNGCPVKIKREHKEEEELQRNAASSTPNLTKERFRFIIFALLKRPKFSNVISWMQDGRSWKIHAIEIFERLIIPVFFPKVTTYSSFVLLTKIFGFKSIPSDPNVWFHSEDFLREEKSLPSYRDNFHALQAFLVEKPQSYNEPHKKSKPKIDTESFFEKCNKICNAQNKFISVKPQQSKQISHTSKQNNDMLSFFREDIKKHHLPKEVITSNSSNNKHQESSTNFQERTLGTTERKRVKSKISEYMSDTFSQILIEEKNARKKLKPMDFF